MVVRLGDGVHKGVHDCVKDDHRERVSLESPHFDWKRLGRPPFGVNNSPWYRSETAATGEKRKSWWCTLPKAFAKSSQHTGNLLGVYTTSGARLKTNFEPRS